MPTGPTTTGAHSCRVSVRARATRTARSGSSIRQAGFASIAVVDPEAYDWEGDAPLRRPFATTVIYEMPVGGSRHPSSSVRPPGKRRIPERSRRSPIYEISVTAVELMPVFQFDPQDCPPGLVNLGPGAPRRDRRLRVGPDPDRGFRIDGELEIARELQTAWDLEDLQAVRYVDPGTEPLSRRQSERVAPTAATLRA